MLTSYQKLCTIYAIQAYLTMNEAFQRLMFDLGVAANINKFTFWFIVVSLMCLLTLIYCLRVDFVFSKTLITVLVLRNIVAVLPVLIPKMYYMFYNGQGSASVDYLPSWFTPFKHLFYIEVIVLTVGGIFGNKIVNCLRRSNSLHNDSDVRDIKNMDKVEKYAVRY